LVKVYKKLFLEASMRTREEFSILKVRLYKDTDYLIKNYLNTKQNKSTYIKNLILKDMRHENIENSMYRVLEDFFKDHPEILNKSTQKEKNEISEAEEIIEDEKPEDIQKEDDEKELPDSAKSFLSALEF
jgi:hypothetical protein